MTEGKFILCPCCKKATHTKVRKDTLLRNFPLYCSRCKKEFIINYTRKERA